MLRKLAPLLAAACIACPAAASATTVIVDGEGTCITYTENGNAGKDRVAPYRLKGHAIPRGNAYLPKGACFKISAEEDISTEFLQEGDYAVFRLQEDFIVNDAVIAPEGTRVFAKVMKLRKAREFGNAGKLALSGESFSLYNGVKVPVSFHFRKHEEGMNTLGLLLVTGVVGSLLVEGRDVVIPRGAEFLASVAEDTDLGLTVDQLRNFGILYGVSEEDRRTDVSLRQSSRP